ncbi:hypothetical protein PAT3040_07140 [Paenibacillus agaridevorans]|uniref:Uncharacterized protein n=1 Tax=Paenibacillus agaridevorans TaxID=171404 RepID=A0A2R5F017_9BACL|nr:hypothetical protein PAT3040_07140 [Paenibacillus agaridevorans]
MAEAAARSISNPDDHAYASTWQFSSEGAKPNEAEPEQIRRHRR